MFHFWLTLRFVTSGRRLLNLPSILSLLGMAIGAASLTVAMAVVSGFEATLEKSTQDVWGHILIVKQSSRVETIETMLDRLKRVAPNIRAHSPFLALDGVVAGKGKITYVNLQGVDTDTVESVLNVRSHLIRGKFEIKNNKGELANALIGKGLARKFELEPGQTFKIVLPNPSRSDSTDFAPKVREFRIQGVLDLGINDLDERSIITDLRSAQDFADVGENFSGLRVRLNDAKQAPATASRIHQELGGGYFIRHWREVNENLFAAVEYEKPVIFFVILVMIVAASVNIASNLFVSVLKKYSDVSILRAMGFSRFDVMKIYTIQGLFFGAVGTAIGILFGLVLCGVFVWAQEHWVLMPADIYKLDHVGVSLQFWDMFMITVASLLISLLSTLMPAFRGARLSTVEGLRYE